MRPFGKQDFFRRHILKSYYVLCMKAIMYESSSSQFLRTTNGIQSGKIPLMNQNSL